MFIMVGINKRIVTYLAITVIAVLLSLQLYASHLGKKATVLPYQRTPDPSIVTPPSPFTDRESFCAKLPTPKRPRTLFVSDKTPKDGPLKIFFWKQIDWGNLNKINWREESEKMCPFSPELQAFFDYFKMKLVKDEALVWTPGFAPCYFWGFYHDYMMGDYTGTCNNPTHGEVQYTFTMNYTEFSSADIILVNYPFLLSKWEFPYFDIQYLPPRIAHQKWVLHFYDESIGYYPHVAYPPFMQQFDLTIGSPPALMDIPHPTYPITEAKALELANVQPGFPLNQATEHYIAFMISNCEAKNNRDELTEEFIQKAGAHSYGGCRHTKDIPKEFEKLDWSQLKTKTLAPYPFGLAAENSNCVGYVTEKFYDVLASGAIPVFMGLHQNRRPGTFLQVEGSRQEGPLQVLQELLPRTPARFVLHCE
ncbi:hypothetical protein BGZ95_006840 [Linnemannia exigua]|uniref:Fucosyltransferase n=1 Tax=Linnemannia exigua TaxID=604196 RepID=A0AAD4H0M7_9FUNG|nr:hypothetical protein BGZ95_006840 [Linnemannia exigua]